MILRIIAKILAKEINRELKKLNHKDGLDLCRICHSEYAVNLDYLLDGHCLECSLKGIKLIIRNNKAAKRV